jgi:xanthosine utilization system XapX-like protein
MKVLLRFVPILASLGACAVVGIITVMIGMNDDSGMVIKIGGVVALVVGFVVLQFVKNKVNKGTPPSSE